MILTPLLLFTVAVVVIFQIVNLWRKTSRYRQCLQEIPSPPGLPIIGHLLQLAQSHERMFLDDRERGRQFYPIYSMWILGSCAVNLLGPEDIELLVTNMKHITKSVLYDYLHAWLGTGLLTSSGAKWQSRRKTLTPAFHFNILQEFLNIFNDETKNLVADLREQCDIADSIDVIQPITQFTLLSIGETAMGTRLNAKNKENEEYKRSIYRIGELMTYRSVRPWIHRDFIYHRTNNGKEELKTVAMLHDFSRKVINERSKQFATSYSDRKRLAMLDLLLSYKADGADIDDEGIREEVDTFMFEGHDTTSMALCFLLMLLANNRNHQDEIYEEIVEVLGNSEEPPTFSDLQDMRFMERCIKESLRLYPSVPMISRVSGEEIQTKSGYTIPKDCMVNVYIYDMHRNPNLYPDPEKFDPDRFLPENVQKRHPFAYLPFSAGPRNCIGQKFAMLEMKAALCGILQNFVLEPVDRPEDIVFITDLVLRPKSGVRVKFVPRSKN